MPRGASPGKGGAKAPATGFRRSSGGGVRGAQTGATAQGATPGLVRTITGAAAGTGSRIRLTATAHGFDTGQQVVVSGVVGTVEANGSWTVVVVTANTFELAGSTFATLYTSGGTASRF